MCGFNTHKNNFSLILIKYLVASYMKLERKQLFLTGFILIDMKSSTNPKKLKVTEFIHNTIHSYCWPTDTEIHNVLAGLLGKRVVP